MKIAGQKNEGAWYRANQFIKSLRQGTAPDLQADLVNAIKNIPSLNPFVSALHDFANKVGVSNDANTVDANVLAEKYGTVGIPRQVWMGQLSFDTYESGGEGAKYVAEHAIVVRQFAHDLRRVVTQFKFGARAMRDIQQIGHAQQGNPGGIADATPNT